MIVCAYDQADQMVADLIAALGDTHSMVVNVSDARAVFDLNGSATPEIIAKLAPIDMKSMQAGTVRRTRFAQIPAVLDDIKRRHGSSVSVRLANICSTNCAILPKRDLKSAIGKHAPKWTDLARGASAPLFYCATTTCTFTFLGERGRDVGQNRS